MCLPPAPCALASITAFAQCHNSSIRVLWEPMEGSVGNSVYTATAEASDRSVLTCNSSASSCDLEGALCGLHYTVIVAASSDCCTSQRSPPYRISMGRLLCYFHCCIKSHTWSRIHKVP